MKSFADVKRRLQVGVALKLTRHDLMAKFPKGSPITLGCIRKIIFRDDDAVQFEGGSWFNFPPVCDTFINGADEFSVALNAGRSQFKTYEFVGG